MNLPLLLVSPAFVVLFKWTCLLALGWLVHGLLRHRHACWRLILWRGILCLGAVLPFLYFFPFPGFKIPIAADAAPVIEVAASLSRGAAVTSVQPVASVTQPTQTPVTATPVSRGAISDLPPTPPKRVSWGVVLLAIWAFGCCFGVIRLLRLHVQLARLRKTTSRPDPELEELGQQIRTRLNVRQEVALRVSDAVTSPFVCGLLKPKIILPQALVQDLSPAEVSTLLSHEIAHLHRHDLFWNVAWRWMQALCWFHPLVWKIPAAHNLACEQEADRVASGQQTDQASYARLLAQLALRVLALPAVETELTANGSSQIAKRLKHLGQKSGSVWNWKHSLAGFGLVGILFLLTAGCQFSKPAPTAKVSPPVQSNTVVVATPPPVVPSAAKPAAQGLAFTGGVFDKITHKPIQSATVIVRLRNYSSTEDRILESRASASASKKWRRRDPS